MKKLILALMLGLGLMAQGQNPTRVYGTNGIRMYPQSNHVGTATVGLDTNLTGFAANTVPTWNGSAFVWGSAGGIPTNWTWSASLLTNTTSNLGLDLATTGPQTNSASSYFGRWSGAITFGDANAVQMFRESSGIGWSIRSAPNANIGFLVGSTFGVRGASVTGSGTIGNGDTSFVYAEDSTTGSYNHILPAVNVNNMKWFKFYKNDLSSNQVNICTQGGTLMSNGNTNYVLRYAGDSVSIWNNGGTTWDIVDKADFPRFFAWMHHESKVVNGNALLLNVLATQLNNEQTYQSAPASNDIFQVKANLGRGSNYTLHVLGIADNNCGQQRWQVTDGAGTRTIGSMDWYNAITALNTVKTAGPFSVLQGGWVVITSTVTNKNGSSSNFYIQQTGAWIDEP